MSLSRPHIIVDDLRVGWGTRVLMEHVTFDVTRGSVFGILGGSGSGKSSERIGNTQEQPKAALPLVSEVRAQKVEVGEAREMRGKLIIDTVTQHPGKTQCLTR